MKWFDVRTCIIVFLLVNRSICVLAQSSYPVNWIDQKGVNTYGSVLVKTQPNSTWTTAGAISSNLIASNTNGWIEFTGASGANFIVGLATNKSIDLPEFSNAILLDHSANTITTCEGSVAVGYGGWQVGDVFRISREGTEVKYYRNGTVFRTVTVNSASVLHVKACIRLVNKSTPPITMSSDGIVLLNGVVSSTETSNDNGPINITADGGVAPYVYNWSSGESTGSINNKPHGSYTLTVNDAIGRVTSRTYGLGFKVNWINIKGINVSGNILIKQQIPATWTNAGAISSNILYANSDGWIEFMGGYLANYLVGLSVNDIIDSDQFSYAILVDYSNNVFYAYEGASIFGLGTWQTGDLFRIAREGGLIRYYKNNVVVRSVSTNPGNVMKVKTSIRLAGKATPNINTSFGGNLILFGSVAGLANNSGSGAISLSAIGGLPSYVYSWTSGDQTSDLNSKPRGTYSVTVTDASGRSSSRTYHIGYKVNWTNTIGVSVVDGILTKTAQARVWTNAGGVSTNILTANKDGWMEFSSDSGKDFLVGLTTNNTIDFDEFSHAIFSDKLTNAYVIYEGSSGVGSGAWQKGDVFRISREGSFVKYYKNDVVIRSVAVNPAITLKIKATLQEQSSTTTINSSFGVSDGIVRTYYAINNGEWTNPSNWSLTEGGAPSSVFPDDIDIAVIKGHSITINGDVKSAGITITSTNNDTLLKVDGSVGSLTVKGNIVMNQDGGSTPVDLLKVQNNAKLEIKNP